MNIPTISLPLSSALLLVPAAGAAVQPEDTVSPPGPFAEFLTRPAPGQMNQIFSDIRRRDPGARVHIYDATYQGHPGLSKAWFSLGYNNDRFFLVRISRAGGAECVPFEETAARLQWLVQPPTPAIHIGDEPDRTRYAAKSYPAQGSEGWLASTPDDYPCVSHIEFRYG